MPTLLCSVLESVKERSSVFNKQILAIFSFNLWEPLTGPCPVPISAVPGEHCQVVYAPVNHSPQTRDLGNPAGFDIFATISIM